jgi:hypothetical protein
MSWVLTIYDVVYDIGTWLYDAYYTVKDWVWPFNLLADPIYYVYWGCRLALNPILSFNLWVDYIIYQVSRIRSWEDIIGLLETWRTMAENAWAWVLDWRDNVLSAIDTWWNSSDNPIRPYVDSTWQSAKDLVANVQKEVSQVHAAWDDFWTTTYPTLISSSDANTLVDTKITEASPFWAGWQDVKNNVVTFITAPLDWLWERFTDWFLGRE